MLVMLALSFAGGVWLLQQQADLPVLYWAGLILLLPFILKIPAQIKWLSLTRNTLIILLTANGGFFYAAWMAQQRLSDELPAALQGQNITLVGVVSNMPRLHERGLGFILDVELVISEGARVPRQILLSTYRNAEDPLLQLHAGERWQLTVRLKQPHGSSNPHNFDFEAWALERNLRAVGYVYGKGENLRLQENVAGFNYYIERMRETIRDKFQRTLGQAPYAGVLSALAIGDQSSIPPGQWQVFTRTGVNHLMSISGLHITMLSGLAFALCYWLWRSSTYLTLLLPARKAATLIGFLVALCYALLSGYGIPAQRTVYMLATVAIALWSSRNIAPSQLLASALLVVLLFDPWSVLSAGFWLSFGAVGLIFYITANRLGQRHWLLEYGRIQWAMSIGLIPPLLALFQQVSLVSPIANAFAIPLVSFVVVPLTLLGSLLPVDWLLQLAHLVISLCMAALEWLSSLPSAVWVQHAPPGWSLLAGMMGVLWILLPRGFPSRWLGLLLLLPMFLIEPLPPEYGSLKLTIFDVGQGLAVSAQTNQHALLYDTGPNFNSEANSGNRIIVPALQGMGISRLDKLILTHNDSDHTGGALSLMQALPVTELLSSLPHDSPILQQSKNHTTCIDGQNWDWDGVNFMMLHPGNESHAEEKISDNDRSCVLRISTGNNAILLTADIEKKSERRLLELHTDKLRAHLLVVPHHGSKTSSTENFVAAVQPDIAVFTAGYRNRFGHPKEEVVQRYRDIGSTLLRSDEDGAILIEMNPQKLTIERYRKTHARYWHQKTAIESTED